MVVVEPHQVVPIEGENLDNPKALCIIRDMIDPQANAVKHTMNLSVTTSVHVFMLDICKQFGYISGTISVHYERQEGTETHEVCLDKCVGQFLEDILSPSVRRHNFTICEREGKTPQKMPPPPPPPPPHSGSQVTMNSDLESGGNTASLDKSTFFSNNTTLEPRPSYNSISSSSASTSSYSATDYSYSSMSKSETGYVGLVNQAMTCYLNSLIQTLYMTPEFRNAIYKFHFDSDTGVKSIPYQLQRLFLLLQTSKKRAAETTDLTKSFGWDSSEVWQQHDVQELCRVMFDALEVSWRETDQEDLINHLYQGKMKDYVKCLECGYESARVDTYLDIPLVIRPFGATVTYKSIIESLDAFVQPETLEGRDQYFCEKCNKKCDAHKGLKIMSFPYLLTLQMKRFDFDYNTMHRIKLNDRMSFPDTLNLNYQIEELRSKSETKLSQEQQEEDSTVLETNTANSQLNDDAVDEGIEVEASCSSSEDVPISDDVLNDSDSQHSDVEGPYIYDLFSIMIHSGSAAGGHYYAYIKCLSDGQWYSFNDQHVTKITYDDIRKTYGGSTTNRGYYSSSYASSANAYMLMYRQKDAERNIDFLCSEDFPDHVKVELRRLNDKAEADRKQKEIDKSTCKIKIFCVHPVLKRKLDHKFEIHKEKTLQEATDLAYDLFELKDVVARDCCRIVKYDDYQDSLECSFEDEEQSDMEKLLGGIKQSYSFDLLLETKRPEQVFQQYKPGGVTVKVYVADMSQNTILEPPVSVRAFLTHTVEEFKLLLAQVVGLKVEDPCCILERFHNDLKPLTVPKKTLKSEGFFKTNKVYVETNRVDDENTAFERSKFYQLLDRYQNTINILVNLPSTAEVGDYQQHSYSCQRSPVGNDSAVESDVNSAENSCDNGSQSCNHVTSSAPSEKLASRTDFTTQDLNMEMRTLNIQSHLSHSDPNVYQASTATCPSVSKGEILESLQRTASRSSLECQDSRSCSQSTQSTNTSAEFSIGNVNSVCDESVDGVDIRAVIDSQIGDQGYSNSENINSDRKVSEESDKSEGGVVTGSGEPVVGGAVGTVENMPEKVGLVASETLPASERLRASKVLPVTESLPTASLPSYSTNDSKTAAVKSNSDFVVPSTEDWDASAKNAPSGSCVFDSLHDGQNWLEPEVTKKYFCAESIKSDDASQRSLSVMVDKRITLAAFKDELEQYVGVDATNFKVYRVYSNSQEFESIRLGETLSFLEDGKINIKLGRALKNGEYRVKVFQLLVNDAEPSKFLLDTIFARGMTVLESKKLILPELKAAHNLDIPLERCRLRKKTWKNPGSIYVNRQVYEDEIPIYPNWEVFLEILPDEEVMTSTSQLAIYLRRWLPSKHELGPFEEVVIQEQTVDHLKVKISELSGINTEDIDIAKGRGTFPYEVSLLEIHTDLDWNPSVTSLGMWPLYICDDGCLVYYRDNKEALAELTDEQRKDIELKESTRISRSSQKVSYSPRKERALKIYTEDTTASNSSSKDGSPSASASTSNATPDRN